MEANIEQFAEILTTMRESTGLSQYELAHRAGVAHHTINRLEKAKIAKPAVDDIAALARFYGLPLERLAAALGVWTIEEQESEIFHPLLAAALEEIRTEAADMSDEEQERFAEELGVILFITRRRRNGSPPSQPERVANLPDWLVPRRHS